MLTPEGSTAAGFPPGYSNVAETVLSKTVLSNRVEKTVFERTVFCVRATALFGGYFLRLWRGQTERTEPIA